MRPKPLEFEDADGKKYVVDILPLGTIRALEEFIQSDERRKMSNIEIGMRVLSITLRRSYPDFDPDEFRVVGGALRLADIVQQIMYHGGMEPTPEGEAQPAQQSTTGTSSTDA